MKKRSVVGVILLSLITNGIYGYYWLVKTKTVLNQTTRQRIPSAWVLFAPLLILLVMVIVVFAGTAASAGNSQATAGINILAIITGIVGVIGIIIVPIFWLLKFSRAVKEYTNDQISTGLSFALLYLLQFVGVAVIQHHFNNMLDSGIGPQQLSGPRAPYVPETPNQIGQTPQLNPLTSQKIMPSTQPGVVPTLVSGPYEEQLPQAPHLPVGPRVS